MLKNITRRIAALGLAGTLALGTAVSASTTAEADEAGPKPNSVYMCAPFAASLYYQWEGSGWQEIGQRSCHYWGGMWDYDQKVLTVVRGDNRERGTTRYYAELGLQVSMVDGYIEFTTGWGRPG